MIKFSLMNKKNGAFHVKNTPFPFSTKPIKAAYRANLQIISIRTKKLCTAFVIFRKAFTKKCATVA